MKPPIYVIGAPRSGTTLTAKILNQHSNVFMPGETHFFEDIYSRRKDLGEHFNKKTIANVCKRLSNIYKRYNEPDDQKRINVLFFDTNKTLNLIREWRNYRDVLTSFMEMQMLYERKKRWGNNVPRDIFNFKDILNFFPDAKFIICVRDARDFLLSYKLKENTSKNNGKFKNYYHPISTLLIWKSSINMISSIRKYVQNENIYINYYEQLVKDTEFCVKSICTFIEEDFEPNMLQVDNQNSSHKINTRGIFSTSVGLWRRKLSSEEVYLAQFLLNKELKRYGYTLYNLEFSYLKFIHFFFTFPIAFIKNINSRIGIRGSFFPYIFRRFNAFFNL